MRSHLTAISTNTARRYSLYEQLRGNIERFTAQPFMLRCIDGKTRFDNFARQRASGSVDATKYSLAVCSMHRCRATCLLKVIFEFRFKQASESPSAVGRLERSCGNAALRLPSQASDIASVSKSNLRMARVVKGHDLPVPSTGSLRCSVVPPYTYWLCVS